MSDIERQKQEAIDEAFKVFGSSAGAYGYLFDCGVAAQADRLAIAVEALKRTANIAVEALEKIK